MAKPLDGVTVVDFTHVISGPYCSMILGDMGAEVIKIEKPGSGEFYREEGIKNKNGVSIVYPNYNRNKKGIALNIKNRQAIEIIKELVAKSDIFVENQRPGLLDKLGLGFEDLKKVNPRIIYVSISGFGKTGPYTHKAAFDMTIAAISGLMSLNGLEGSVPLKTGAACSDFLAGIYAAFGAVLALRQRDATNEGQFIDISMLESIISIFD
ncbi:MAG: CaiB/BaiF CoA transferase family protein, partial [Sporomusa sp.]